MAGIGGQSNPLLRAGRVPGQSRDNPPFLDGWVSRSAFWGTRHGLGESLDRYFGLHTPSLASDLSNQFAELGIDNFEGKQSGPLTYGTILKLDNSYVSWNKLSWTSFIGTVRKNTYEFCQAIKSHQSRSFFAEIAPNAYVKDTLWESNVKPFKELLNGSKQNWFMNLGYTVGLALMGANIVKTEVQHYHYWKQREDRSLSSRIRTIYETGKAVCQKLVQSLGSWEAAGVGMAIGRALIPIGALPIGGILMGSLFATVAYQAIGKLFASLARPCPSES